MSTFDDPFDSSRRLNSGCACGRHVGQAEHDHEAQRVLQCARVESPGPSAEMRYRGVVAAAAMRAAFPKGA